MDDPFQLPQQRMYVHRCTQCSYQSDLKFQVDHHFQRTHVNVYPEELLFYDITILEPEQLKCVCCSFQCYFSWELYEHYKQQHHGRIDENLEPNAFCNRAVNKYHCTYRKCEFETDSSLLFIKHTKSCELAARRRNARSLATSIGHDATHVNDSSNVKIHACSHCSYRSKYAIDLKRHIIAKHAKDEEIDWFHCEKCAFKTKHRGSLKSHKMRHVPSDEIDWVACNECPYKTKTKSNLKRHLRRHARSSDSNWFMCNNCLYKSKEESNLKTHTCRPVTSEEVEWTRCKKCSYRTKHKGYMKTHMLTHATSEEIDWFSCAKCPYRARVKSTLKKHMLNHAAADEVDRLKCDLEWGSVRTELKENAV